MKEKPKFEMQENYASLDDLFFDLATSIQAGYVEFLNEKVSKDQKLRREFDHFMTINYTTPWTFFLHDKKFQKWLESCKGP